MPARIPSLNGLKAFEAAARHLSFTAAAAELNVTQTAISHQIRRLEEELGVRLFSRLKNDLALTAEGEAYFPGIHSAFEQLKRSTQTLLRPHSNATLTISTLVSFASKWLLPRLASFQAAHPDIDVRVSASTGLSDLGRGGIDAAIRYGDGQWKGLRADWLMSDDVFPVCSPALLPALQTPEDLVGQTLLQVSGLTGADWNLWLEAAGLPGEMANSTRLTFDLAMMAVQAAVDGMGVCIGRTTYVEEDLKAGRLVKPFGLTLQAEEGFYLVTPQEAQDTRQVAAFRAWLSEAIRQRSPLDSP